MEYFHKPLGIPPRRWLDMDCLDGLRMLRIREKDDPSLLELRSVLASVVTGWDNEQRQEFVNSYVCEEPNAGRPAMSFLILLSIFSYTFHI